MRVERVVSAAVLALLATPGLLPAAEGGGGDLFSMDFGLSVWTIVVFLSLLFILWKFAWGPILDVVDERERRIQGALDQAARQQKEAEALLREHKEQLADARRQAQQIIQEGKEAGQKVREQIEAKAREEGQSLLERARIEIEREKERALESLREQSVDVAMAAAARLLGEKMDEKTDRRLVRQYLDDLSGEEGDAGEEGVRA